MQKFFVCGRYVLTRVCMYCLHANTWVSGICVCVCDCAYYFVCVLILLPDDAKNKFSITIALDEQP